MGLLDRLRDAIDMCMTGLKFLSRACAIAGLLVVGGCTGLAEYSVLGTFTGGGRGPPAEVQRPVTPDEELKSKVRRDGYPDPNYVPNPKREPALTPEESTAIMAEMGELGRQRMENRIMNCGAEDPANCVQ